MGQVAGDSIAVPGHGIDAGSVPAGTHLIHRDLIALRKELDHFRDHGMSVRMDGPDEARGLDHPVVHADLGLTPLHGLGQDVVQPGVADEEARGVVKPGFGVEIETLHAGETCIGNRFALPEQ